MTKLSEFVSRLRKKHGEPLSAQTNQYKQLNLSQSTLQPIASMQLAQNDQIQETKRVPGWSVYTINGFCAVVKNQ